MEWLRGSLRRLGWPIEDLSDEQLARLLYQRWVACGDEELESGREISVAAAHGIFDSMAKEGNLDALCWQEGDVLEEIEDASWAEGGPIHARDTYDTQPEDRDQPERRESTRTDAADVIRFGEATAPEDSCGWLVDVSTDGIAFIAETHDVPVIGTKIFSTVEGREGETTELGDATVVRTELLSEFLTLVCAQRGILGEPGP